MDYLFIMIMPTIFTIKFKLCCCCQFQFECCFPYCTGNTSHFSVLLFTVEALIYLLRRPQNHVKVVSKESWLLVWASWETIKEKVSRNSKKKQSSRNMEWSVIRVVFHKRRVVSYQDGFLSGWFLVRVVFYQDGFLLGWSLIRVLSCQGGLSSEQFLVRVVSHQGSLLSWWSLVRVIFCQGGLMSGWSLAGVISHQGFHWPLWLTNSKMKHQ